MAPSPVPGILALGILTYDDPIEITGLAITEGGPGPAEDLGWTYIGVLLKRLADRKP